MSSSAHSGTTRILAEAGALVGLAAALYMISFIRLPYGGKISFEMLPIYFLSYRRGWKAGALGGLCLGFLLLALDPVVVHPAQFILDYPAPHMMVGFASFFSRNIYIGILAGGFGRFASHFISGLIFFGAFAPEGSPVWLYSLIYNGSYVIPQMVLALIFLPLLLKRTG